MSDEIIDITADEAVDAITEADFVTEEGRHVVHSVKVGSGLSMGADWETENAIKVIREKATRIAFCDHWLYGWCLAIEVPGESVTIFDGVKPQPKSEKEARGE